MTAHKFVEVHRGPFEESEHWGHAVICDGAGAVVEAWGDPDAVILPRSSSKMIQALPLFESGAGAGLTTVQQAFACASHAGAAIHRDMARAWLRDMGLGDDDLRCGVHAPYSQAAADDLVRAGETPCQVHNNCSGKHCGFLMLSRHLKAGPEYVEVDHPVQLAVREAFEDVTGLSSLGYGIDGCSAPNFATTMTGLAAAMGRFSAARADGDARARAMHALTRAMAAHPEYVSGEGRACTMLMRAMEHKVAVKTGAEAVYVAIVPELQRGIAVKILDGGTRASEAVITALLVRLGVLDAGHPVAQQYMIGPIRNRRGIVTGALRVVPELVR
jgi:L-asparaginase II